MILHLLSKITLSRLIKCISFTAIFLAHSLVITNATEQEDIPVDTIDLDSLTIIGGSIQSLMNTENTNKYTTALTNSTIGIPQDLKDTTQSISLITRQRMEDQPDLHRVIDVVNNATGLSYTQNETEQYNIISRGMNVDSISYDGVTNYYDTRFNYGDNHMDTALYDRIEVVRGATGFMTGAGNPSASLNLVRKRPSSEFKGYIATSLGSWNLKRIESDIGGKLNSSGSIRGRIVGILQDRKSFLDRYQSRRKSIFGTLEVDLTPTTLFNIGADFQKNTPEASMPGGLPLFFSNGELTNYPDNTNTAPSWARSSTKVFNIYSSLEHEFDNGWQTSANLTYSRNTLASKSANVYGPPSAINNTGMITDYINYIQGKRTQKTFDWKLNGSFEAFGRYHFLRVNYNYTQSNHKNAYYNPLTGTLPPSYGNFRDPNFTFPEPSFEKHPFAALQGTNKQHALSVITELSLTDQLLFTAGIRLNHMKINDTSFGPYFHPYNNSFSQPSKYLSMSYKLSDQYSLYASYTDIFQPQSVLDATGKYLDPTIGKNYEIGFKAGLFDDRLNFSTALFEIKRNNIAEATNEYLPSGQGIYRAINGAKTRGFDIELAGAITDHWNIQAGYTSYVSRDAKGHRISQDNPNQMLKLFTTYRLPNKLSNITIGGGINWVSDTKMNVTTPQGTPFEAIQKSYTIANVMLRYDMDKDTHISLNINNIFNQKYYTNYGLFTQYQYGSPRNILVSFKHDF